MAENPTSSSTMYTTLGAPSGAPGRLERRPVRHRVPDVDADGSLKRRVHRIPRFRSASSVPVLVPCAFAARPGSAAEQFGLGGSELLVGQRALLAQVVELVELIDHGRSRCRGRRRRGWWRGLLVLLLRLKVRDALVLVRIRVRLLLPPPARGPAGRVRAATDHGRAHQWASPDHDLPPS